MEHPEVPLEQSQEDIAHHAHHAIDQWVMGVALTAALLAALAAITALLAEHHANEAMLQQIRSSDQWSYFQAKSIKASVLSAKLELLAALGKPVGEADGSKTAEYKQDQEQIKEKAEELQRESLLDMKHHAMLSRALTMFQVAIAVAAISVLTKRKMFWFVCIGFGVVGAVLLLAGISIA